MMMVHMFNFPWVNFHRLINLCQGQILFVIKIFECLLVVGWMSQGPKGFLLVVLPCDDYGDCQCYTFMKFSSSSIALGASNSYKIFCLVH